VEEAPDAVAASGTFRWFAVTRFKRVPGLQIWRIDLRSGGFMDDEPYPADVPNELIELITEAATWQMLCDDWDQMYPNHLVAGVENED
jgi:hypothetical protein